ncbi:MAG TPA: hypothetical protein VNG51_26995 [Ktedonobacteraceae bacterium]|nr:hypothetical protein [Ktedonobacteraceae bacterium]
MRLRELHREMDEAVARAYGWNDLRLDHGFHETKQGLRYTISEEARREVLDRLLLLNHQRHAEEVAAGLFEQKGGKKSVKSANGKQGAKATQGKQVLATGHTSERGGNGTQRNGQNGGNVEDKENNIIEGMAQDSLF